jgi:ketosteroid isomerase-like protein
MTQANLDVVRRLFDDWLVGEISEANFHSAFHPDVEFLPLRSATEGAYRGIAGIERFVADTEEIFDKFEFHYDLLDLGERVLAWGKIQLRARGSGIETDIPMGGVFEFRDGKIVRWEDFGSKDKALEAVGRAG